MKNPEFEIESLQPTGFRNLWIATLLLKLPDQTEGTNVSQNIKMTLRISHEAAAPTEDLLQTAYNAANLHLSSAAAYLAANTFSDLWRKKLERSEAEERLHYDPDDAPAP